MPFSPFDWRAAAPSAKDFLTNATMSALDLYCSRLGSSAACCAFPMTGLMKKQFDPAACSNCSAKLRCAGVGLKSYLSSGKSSAIAVSLRPTSFQESSTTFSSGSAGLTAASFFIASWACAGNAHASRTIARNGILFISFSTIEFRNQSFNFLFRLRQLRNNCGNFFECLVPALELTAIFRALHGFISNEGEFRPAVSQILKDGHVVRTLYGLMFYSYLRRVNFVFLRVRKEPKEKNF